MKKFLLTLAAAALTLPAMVAQDQMYMMLGTSMSANPTASTDDPVLTKTSENIYEGTVNIAKKSFWFYTGTAGEPSTIYKAPSLYSAVNFGATGSNGNFWPGEGASGNLENYSQISSSNTGKWYVSGYPNNATTANMKVTVNMNTETFSLEVVAEEGGESSVPDALYVWGSKDSNVSSYQNIATLSKSASGNVYSGTLNVPVVLESEQYDHDGETDGIFNFYLSSVNANSLTTAQFRQAFGASSPTNLELTEENPVTVDLKTQGSRINVTTPGEIELSFDYDTKVLTATMVNPTYYMVFNFTGEVPENINNCISIIDQWTLISSEGNNSGALNIDSNPYIYTYTSDYPRLMLDISPKPGYKVLVVCNNSNDYISVQSGNGNTTIQGAGGEDCNGLEFTFQVEEIKPVYLGIGYQGAASSYNEDYVLEQTGDYTYEGSIKLSQYQTLNIWYPVNISFGDETANYMPFGPATDELENILFSNSDKEVIDNINLTTEGCWQFNNEVDVTVQITLDMYANTVTFKCLTDIPVYNATINFSGSDLKEDTVASDYVEFSKIDIENDSFNTINVEDNTYQFQVNTNDTFVFSPALDGVTLTVTCSTLTADQLNEKDIILSDNIEGLGGFAANLEVPDGSWILMIGSAAVADGLTFNVEVVYEPKEPETVTVDFVLKGIGIDAAELTDLVTVSYDGEDLTFTNLLVSVENAEIPAEFVITVAEGYGIQVSSDVEGTFNLQYNGETFDLTVFENCELTITVETLPSGHLDFVIGDNAGVIESLTWDGTTEYISWDEQLLDYNVTFGDNVKEGNLLITFSDNYEVTKVVVSSTINDKVTTENATLMGNEAVAVIYAASTKTVISITAKPISSGISSFNSIDENASIYTLQGVRVDRNNLVKGGIYIVNSKKVAVK